MIARLWRGWTRSGDADAYASYIQETGLRGYLTTPGNRGAYLLRRRDGERTEFLTLSFWEDEEAISSFAGPEVDNAVFYPEDDRYLIDRETKVRHYTVVEGGVVADQRSIEAEPVGGE